jgi:hypothetical protein
MKKFRNLILRGESEQLRATMEEVARRLSDGWSRNTEIEKRLRSTAVSDEPAYCFSCEQREQRPAASVFFDHEKSDVLYVPNVIPRDQRQLSIDEYNVILAEFYERFVSPAAACTGVRSELTDTHGDLSRWLSSEAIQKFRTFAMTASRTTGSALQTDQDCWMDFIVAAHRDNSSLDARMLQRWLTEEENWAPEVAARLAFEYEIGRKVLAFSEGRRRSA